MLWKELRVGEVRGTTWKPWGSSRWERPAGGITLVKTRRGGVGVDPGETSEIRGHVRRGLGIPVSKAAMLAEAALPSKA